MVSLTEADAHFSGHLLLNFGFIDLRDLLECRCTGVWPETVYARTHVCCLMREKKEMLRHTSSNKASAFSVLSIVSENSSELFFILCVGMFCSEFKRLHVDVVHYIKIDPIILTSLIHITVQKLNLEVLCDKKSTFLWPKQWSNTNLTLRIMLCQKILKISKTVIFYHLQLICTNVFLLFSQADSSSSIKRVHMYTEL